MINPYDLFGFDRPNFLGGMKVIEHKPFPKLQVGSHVEMTDEFRDEINTWLIDMFGYSDSLLPKGQFIVSQDYGFVVARSDDLALLRASLS